MSRRLLIVSTLGAAAFGAAMGIPRTALAQSITASGQVNPIRLVPDKSKTICGTDPATDTSCVSQRPVNLTPLGISYQDCVDDQWLRFSVLLSGFAGGDNVSVWASLTSDCTAITDRGGAGSVASVCWQLNAGISDPVQNTAQTYPFDVRVQDIVGNEQHPPFPAIYQPISGANACNQQGGFAAVPMYVDFVITDSENNGVSGSYQFNLNTDLVGPPAPGGVNLTAGDTLLNVSWTANSDADTAGYMLFIDPPPGGSTTTGTVGAEGSSTLQDCPDTGLPPLEAGDEADASDDSGAESDALVDGASTTDASFDASGADATPPGDAGCTTVNHGGSPRDASGSGTCYDPVLASGTTQDGGTTTVELEASTTTTVDGEVVETDAGTVEEGSGGISGVDSSYSIGVNEGFTIADKSVGNYVIKNLVNNVTYNVVVSSVDGFGNVGPPSQQTNTQGNLTCNYPAPINDFWSTYEKDGGAGGGFCSLESVGAGGESLLGVGFVFAAAAFIRRRRRNVQ
ncbi:MAG TPA: hypothetical protein VGG39_31940 [Polyangiaceae bacterium]|jgi:hypothetical protein